MRNVRGGQPIRSSLDAIRGREIPTMIGISLSKEEKEILKRQIDPQWRYKVVREVRKFADQDKAVTRARKHLASLINTNRVLTAVRCELQRARHQGITPSYQLAFSVARDALASIRGATGTSSATPSYNPGYDFPVMELRYSQEYTPNHDLPNPDLDFPEEELRY